MSESLEIRVRQLEKWAKKVGDKLDSEAFSSWADKINKKIEDSAKEAERYNPFVGHEEPEAECKHEWSRLDSLPPKWKCRKCPLVLDNWPPPKEVKEETLGLALEREYFDNHASTELIWDFVVRKLAQAHKEGYEEGFRKMHTYRQELKERFEAAMKDWHLRPRGFKHHTSQAEFVYRELFRNEL